MAVLKSQINPRSAEFSANATDTYSNGHTGTASSSAGDVRRQ